jgi:hypothetical protein
MSWMKWPQKWTPWRLHPSWKEFFKEWSLQIPQSICKMPELKVKVPVTHRFTETETKNTLITDCFIAGTKMSRNLLHGLICKILYLLCAECSRIAHRVLYSKNHPLQNLFTTKMTYNKDTILVHIITIQQCGVYFTKCFRAHLLF